jgi:hypothetical protein
MSEVFQPTGDVAEMLGALDTINEQFSPEAQEINKQIISQEILDGLAELKHSLDNQLPDCVNILRHIHKQLVACPETVYLLNDEQVATMLDVLLPASREQITPTKKTAKKTATTSAKIKDLMKVDTSGAGVDDM